jgi:hypothetical protein
MYRIHPDTRDPSNPSAIPTIKRYSHNGLLGFILSLQGSFQQAIELLEYTTRQVAEQFPHNQEVIRRVNFPTLAYCYANLSQTDLAKSIIDR